MVRGLIPVSVEHLIALMTLWCFQIPLKARILLFYLTEKLTLNMGQLILKFIGLNIYYRNKYLKQKFFKTSNSLILKAFLYFRARFYIICFELNLQIIKIYVKLHVNSYFSHEIVILFIWIAKNIEVPSEGSKSNKIWGDFVKGIWLW